MTFIITFFSLFILPPWLVFKSQNYFCHFAYSCNSLDKLFLYHYGQLKFLYNSILKIKLWIPRKSNQLLTMQKSSRTINFFLKCKNQRLFDVTKDSKCTFSLIGFYIDPKWLFIIVLILFFLNIQIKKIAVKKQTLQYWTDNYSLFILLL